MSVIQIPFERSPSSVSIASRVSASSWMDSGANAAQAAPPATPPAAAAEDTFAAAALRSLVAIDNKLSKIDDCLKEEMASMRAHLVAAATQIATEALGSDDSLIEKRVAHFAEILLRQVHPDRSAVFFVHPRCVAYLTAWISDSGRPAIDIQADATVEPGDCRIEFGDKGFLASLESFLDAAAKQNALGSRVN